MSNDLIWMIDEDLINTEPGDTKRINYGQRVNDAQSTQQAYESMRQRITMSNDCSVIEIPREEKIRWKAYDDDGQLYYKGHIRAKYLLEDDCETDIDYGYMVEKFVEADAGAIRVYWNVDDIAKHNPEYAESHPKSDKQGWIEIYG